MSTFYLICTALGGAILVLQVLLSLVGVGDDHPGDHALDEGLDLLSVRALSAALAFFGAGGLVGGAVGLPIVVGLPLGLAAGAAAMVATAWATRAMLRLESDRTPMIEEAIGERGVVYLAIPPQEGGVGKVHVTLRGRLVELSATSRGEAIPTGAPVQVVDTSGETLIVAPVTSGGTD